MSRPWGLLRPSCRRAARRRRRVGGRRCSARAAERIDELEGYFRGGECDLEVVETHASGELAVLVVVERQHGVVGHLPAQDWSLRVTLVFRREQGAWRLVHRHADPLVHPITYDRLAELARG